MYHSKSRSNAKSRCNIKKDKLRALSEEQKETERLADAARRERQEKDLEIAQWAAPLIKDQSNILDIVFGTKIEDLLFVLAKEVVTGNPKYQTGKLVRNTTFEYFETKSWVPGGRLTDERGTLYYSWHDYPNIKPLTKDTASKKDMYIRYIQWVLCLGYAESDYETGGVPYRAVYVQIDNKGMWIPTTPISERLYFAPRSTAEVQYKLLQAMEQPVTVGIRERLGGVIYSIKNFKD